MKKVCVFLMFVLVVCGGFPAYATTDIAADAENSECTENITGTYSGDANFKAKWTPNNIQLNWYNNNTLMQGVNSESNTCNYGTTLTIPTTPPERIGYIFDGWKVRPKMDFSTLTSLPNGTQCWGKGAGYCYYNVGIAGYTRVDCKTTEGFASLNQKEWKVQYNSGNTKGTLYGSAWCSVRSGSNVSGAWNRPESFATTEELDEAPPSDNRGHNCYCQATGWQPENSDIIYANSNNISWGDVSVLSSDAWVYRTTESSCNLLCAYECAYRAWNDSNFRRALFIGDGN